MNGSFVETETWTHICGFEEILQRKKGKIKLEDDVSW